MPEILLYGEILPGMAREVKAAIAAAASGEELVVRIDSEGGSVFEGLSIYDAIASYDGPKRSVIESAAFSIASLIACACDSVEITQNGYMMIHNPYAAVQGDDEELAKQSEVLAKLKETMARVYSTRTGMTEDDVLALMRDEAYFNATEAVATGLVDSVLATSKPSTAVAKDTTKNRLPHRVVLALVGQSKPDAASSTHSKGSQMTTNETPERQPVTIAQLKKAFPKAKAEFYVRAMEEEMTMEEAQAEQMKELQAENDDLKAKLSAMEEELEEAKAKAKAEESESEEEEEETVAKASATGARPIARVSNSGGKVSASAKWRAEVQRFIEAGQPRHKAVQLANRHNPGLRQQYLEEINA